MAFVRDKQELKPGLILFRRGDVGHSKWYCRIKIPKAERYKTVSLRTDDLGAARALAFERETEVRLRLQYDMPVFSRTFEEIAQEYLLRQERRARAGAISEKRFRCARSVINAHLIRYVGGTRLDRLDEDC